VGPRTVLDAVVGRESNPRTPIVQLVNINTDLKEIRCEGVGWIHVVQDRDKWWALVNTVMNLWIP